MNVRGGAPLHNRLHATKQGASVSLILATPAYVDPNLFRYGMIESLWRMASSGLVCVCVRVHGNVCVYACMYVGVKAPVRACECACVHVHTPVRILEGGGGGHG